VARRDDDPFRRLEGGQGLGGDHDRGPATGAARPFNDSWIAACCIEGGLPLLTLNLRDFADFAEQDGLVLLRA
jgi:predicted nucleic acid-binding protein